MGFCADGYLTCVSLAGGKSRSPLHVALLHLRCAGSGALWQTGSVTPLGVNTGTKMKHQKVFLNPLVSTAVTIYRNFPQPESSLSLSPPLSHQRPVFITRKEHICMITCIYILLLQIGPLLPTHFLWQRNSTRGKGISNQQQHKKKSIRKENNLVVKSSLFVKYDNFFCLTHL